MAKSTRHRPRPASRSSKGQSPSLVRSQTKDDPIFSLMEVHKAAARAHRALLDKQEAFEKTFDFGAPEITALERQVKKALNSAMDALKALCETSPRSTEGFTAWLRYLRSYVSDGIEGMYANGATDSLWKTLEKTAKHLASRRKQ